MSRRIVVEFTEAEARNLLYALGNSIGDGEDEQIFVHKPQRDACWRAHNKIESALARLRRPTNAQD